MHAAGIDDGDVLLVDRALTARHESIVVAVINGDLLCRRLEQPDSGRHQAREASLVATDSTVAPIAITAEAPLEVWGVVTTVIKSLV